MEVDIDQTAGFKCNFCSQGSEAKYTCPRCNSTYCSVTCYQSQQHSGCSESFYKDCVTDEIKMSERNPEEKRKMMEMLKRLEEQEEDQDELLDSDDCDSCADLAERLQGVDLDDADIVWEQLNEVERAEFHKMMETGELNKLVPTWEPWWCPKKTKLVQELNDDDDEEDDGVPQMLPGVPPLSKIMKKAPSPVVKYSLVNILYSYAYMMRLYNGEPDHEWSNGVLGMSGALREGHNYDNASLAISSCAHSLLEVPDIMDKKIKKEAERDVLNIVIREEFVDAALSHLYELLHSYRIKCKHQKKGTLRFSMVVIKSAMKKVDFFRSWIQEYFYQLSDLT